MSYCDLPWFPLWVEDWRTSRKVKAVPRHIRSMYLDLLIEIWVDGPLTDDESMICSFLGCDPRTFGKDWKLLRPMLTPWGAGLLSDDKLEEVRVEQLAKAEKQRKRAQSRWDKVRQEKLGNTVAAATEMPRHVGGNAISEERSEIPEETRGDARAHTRGPEHFGPAEAELSKAWVNAGLRGSIGSGHELEVITQELAQRGHTALAACKAWKQLIDSFAARGTVTKQQPAKLLEHLRAGLISQVIAGEIKTDVVASRGRTPPMPHRLEPPSYPRAADLEDELEANRERLNREREERDRRAAGGQK